MRAATVEISHRGPLMIHNPTLRRIAFVAFLSLFGFGAVASTGCGASAIPQAGVLPYQDHATGTHDDGVTPVSNSGNATDGDVVDSTIIGDTPFANARALSVGPGDTEAIDGEIAAPTAVDVYDIGSVQAGERLIVSVDPQGDLDPVLAVFDANGDSMMINDDRNYYGGDFSSRINMRARHASAACFLAVASSHRSGTRGPYTLTVTRGAPESLGDAAPQRVYLNFDGAESIVIGQREPVTMPTFEGSQIADEFDGRTDELIQETVAHIRRDYEGLAVEFVSSREAPRPAGGLTTIHFGAYDPGLLGIADYVDEFNEAPTQKAIVFVDTFKAFHAVSPSLEEMAAALANVASHETGHLLGLQHTADPHDVMDITASLRQMLANQAFNRSPLHREVFPIGYQDSARLLVEAVGGDLGKVKANAAAQLNLRLRWYDQGDPLPARLDRRLSTCFCPSCDKHR